MVDARDRYSRTPLPLLGSDHTVRLAQFKNEAARITAAYERRRNAEKDRKAPVAGKASIAAGAAQKIKPAPPWDNANGYLKREVYRLGRWILPSHGADVRALVIANRRKPRDVTFKRSAFHWLLIAVEGKQRLLTPADRRLFAAQLDAAFYWELDEKFIVGAFHQLGWSREDWANRIGKILGGRKPICLDLGD